MLHTGSFKSILLLAAAFAASGAIIIDESQTWVFTEAIDGKPAFRAVVRTTVDDSFNGDPALWAFRYKITNVDYRPEDIPHPYERTPYGEIRWFILQTGYVGSGYDSHAYGYIPPMTQVDSPGWRIVPGFEYIGERSLDWPGEVAWVEAAWGGSPLTAGETATFMLLAAPPYTIKRGRASLTGFYMDHYQTDTFRGTVPVPGVPEPGSILLVSTALLAALLYRRRGALRSPRC